MKMSCQTGVILLGLLAWAGSPGLEARDTVSLSGEWRVRLDVRDEGLGGQWYSAPIATRSLMRLPGTTDLAGLGAALDPATLRYSVEFPYSRFPGVNEPERADERGFLVRRHFHLGPAWYERDLDIPAAWGDRFVSLRLERALWKTEAWVDGLPAGAADSLATPHEHRLGRLSPGRHRLTLRIDNRMIWNISTITHAYGPETQSRWNGAVGRIELEARPAVALRRLDVFPAPDRKSVRVVASIDVAEGRAGQGVVLLSLRREGGNAVLARSVVDLRSGPGEARIEGVLNSESAAEPWDEFRPARYRIDAELVTSDGLHSKADSVFGFRQIERDGKAIRVNGRRVFLRGTLDCAVYPRTGHPPMTVAEWVRVLGTVKENGFNHVRFHTWCPPEAAFEAADRLGIYLMPETAAWVDDWTRSTYGAPKPIGRDPEVTAFVRSEMRRVVEAYGNHPSFALFCIGNEFGMGGTDWDAVAQWLVEAKRDDPRRLFTAATARKNLAPDDLWVTHSANGKSTRGVGAARTDWDFTPAAEASPVPVIAHETGQHPVFPDYDALLPKFTGPLQPLNYVRLRDRLVASGMAGQARDFVRASARFQMVEYKAEHEAMRRTAGFAGYQLLMLNDFTGQSEALVGILDPFWESKGVVSSAEVRAWNSATVPLARFERYTWSTAESFHASIEIAHHGPRDLENVRVAWDLVARGGKVVARGRFEPAQIPTGGLTPLGAIDVDLRKLGAPTELTLGIRCGKAWNSWRVWAYPPEQAPVPDELMVAQRFDDSVRVALDAGRNVLLLAHGIRGTNAAQTGFESVYWSAGWWGNTFSSLGILCDPGHPALAGFPNGGFSDWQWHALTQGATTFRFDRMPPGFQPIVQAVPDFHFNSLLGQVFEARVGKGRLLVCGYDLMRDLEHRHAARQFRSSLMRYLGSESFRPRSVMEFDTVEELFRGATQDARQGR